MMKSGLGLFVGLVCYAALGWALNRGLLDPIIAGGVALWLLIAYVGGALLVIAGLLRFFSREPL